MKCEDILKALDLYLEGDEASSVCVAFREHLAGCERCRVVVDSIKNTVTLFKETGESIEMPTDCRERLHETLRKKWQDKKS
jgi:predicted anti-sigma-YlaC factor YlaD